MVIIVWVTVLGGLLLARQAFGGAYADNYTVPGSESSQGQQVLNRTFPQQGGYAGLIVFHARTGTVAGHRAAVDAATSRVARLPHVTRAVGPFTGPRSPAISRDGTIAYSTVSFNVVPASLGTSYLDLLNRAVAPARAAGLQVEYGGGTGMIGQAPQDVASEVIGVTCALVVLIALFGSLVAAVMPLVSAIFGVAAGLSVVGLLAAGITFPTPAPTVATLLGLGVAIDYGLFLVARHRDQLDAGHDVTSSAAQSEATSGAAVVVAGGTVVVSILGLYVSGVPFIGSMGLAAAIVVAVTVVTALTLVPALLGAVRGLVRALRPLRRAPRDHERRVFSRWGRHVTGQPWPWAAVGVTALVVLSIPLFSLRLGQIDQGANPVTDSSRRAYDLMAQGFGPGANGPLGVVVVLPSGSAASERALLGSLRASLAATPGVAAVTPATVNPARTTAVLTVVPATSPQSAATSSLVNRLRADVLPRTPVTTYVTGFTAANVDLTEKTGARMPWFVLTVVAISFVLLAIAFRAVIVAAKAAVLNLLSVGASYGVIVAVFQWGWGSGLIGIGQKLPIPAFVPMLVFAIVFGLSMDYEVFLLSRVRETWAATREPRAAIVAGLGGTARVITTAAAIMVAVFASFVLDSDPTVKMLAVGMAVAVIIDASIVRMLLVPSLMALLGSSAWWIPRWLDRILPRVHLEESDIPVTAGAQDSGRTRMP